jgi:hypothetical protein
MRQLDVRETETNFPALLAKVEKTGEDVILYRANKPVWKIALYKSAPTKKRVLVCPDPLPGKLGNLLIPDLDSWDEEDERAF